VSAAAAAALHPAGLHMSGAAAGFRNTVQEPAPRAVIRHPGAFMSPSKKPLFCALAGIGLCCGAAWAAVGPDALRSLDQRVPTLPSSAALSAGVFERDPQTTMTLDPASVAALRRDLMAARESFASSGADRGMGSSFAPSTPEQAQALQQRVQNMSQAEQMAFAMQMQQQMMGGDGFSLSEAENAAVEAAEALAQDVAADSDALAARRRKVEQFLAEWVRQNHEMDAISRDQDGSMRATDATQVCTEAQRRELLQWNKRHTELADRQLRAAAALMRELQTFGAGLQARAERTTAVAAQIKAAAAAQPAINTREGAAGNLIGLIETRLDLYATAGRYAAQYPHRYALDAKAPLSNSSECRS
jgi:hypothetical protein